MNGTSMFLFFVIFVLFAFGIMIHYATVNIIDDRNNICESKGWEFIESKGNDYVVCYDLNKGEEKYVKVKTNIASVEESLSNEEFENSVHEYGAVTECMEKCNASELQYFNYEDGDCLCTAQNEYIVSIGGTK